MVVEHNSTVQLITVRGGVKDGSVFSEEWCNHHGAVKTLIPILHYSEDAHTFVADDAIEQMVCDKCFRQKIDTDEGEMWV